jgi:hypothetical protein
MIPLKIMMVGMHWQLLVIIGVMAVLLCLAWKYLHAIRLPISWPFVLIYAVTISAVLEGIYLASKLIDAHVPIHLEVLLPAFVLGCVLARPAGADPHRDDAKEGHEEGPEDPIEQKVSTIISATFMILVGLSMPPILHHTSHNLPTSGDTTVAVDEAPSALKYEGADSSALAAKNEFPGWGIIGIHVLVITVLCNIGKMFPAFCYRGEASLRERLGLAVGMFPRGEVGAGVLVVSLSYGLGGPTLAVAVLSLALNLLCTGLFIIVVKKLIALPKGTVAEGI